ncbi:MAG TPA: radical SAM protein, partial [Polyangia bacterium]
MNLIRNLEKLAARSARAAWPLVKLYNEKFERPSPKPEWAPAPLLKRRERTFPQLGWPRTTDSLCPRCVKETREAILDGKRSFGELLVGKPGEIKADIVEENGQIVMKKTCDKHGTFTDVMAIDAKWLERIERLYPGRDFVAPKTPLREHGSSSIQFGRGSVLTVDLTNRCNRMCDPCFMDANQVGYVHELTWADIQKILDDAMSIQPRR